MPPPAAGRHTTPPAAATTRPSSADTGAGPGHQLVLVVPLAGADPLRVAAELPATDAGRHGGGEHRLELALRDVAAPPEQPPPPPVEVAVHEVGAADPPLR